MKKLYEHYKGSDGSEEMSNYDLVSDYEKHSIYFDDTFSEQARGKLVGSIKDTGDGYIVKLSKGYVSDSLLKKFNLDYSQAVSLLGLLLLTHKEHKFSVTSEPEKLN